MTRLQQIHYSEDSFEAQSVISALTNDDVALISGVEQDIADDLIFSVCELLGLDESLELQAGFASIQGHRQTRNDFYMTVNRRRPYQFIPPHSEGSSFSKMQLAAFYCIENSTDGGETILWHVNANATDWNHLKEKKRKCKVIGTLTDADKHKIRTSYQLDVDSDRLLQDEEILTSQKIHENVTMYEVLSKPEKTHSIILDSYQYAYWDSISSLDHDCAIRFQEYCKRQSLLKVCSNNSFPMDNAAQRRLRNFGVNFDELFDHTVIHKLQPGQLIIFNNISWAHSAANWTPDSGVRNVVGAFA
ncbi:TauD/TfdA family dioxygenase [Pseudoalteromonas luteoviolacea]|uniref:TauD/TfdA family dioxygenase n=1 Tax=Pseudoalteromonas luteoviolacea TaxID=43657 RepID=UPI001F27ED49|nr:TauD/TfdA family dioxygenase [Pseudoalteromonas luteoviolacea]MCF6442843.1 TauD/TfdA family dioxygenase [Pseudoalteromonas luteoviolacea]